jgi:hypothetical protein
MSYDVVVQLMTTHIEVTASASAGVALMIGEQSATSVLTWMSDALTVGANPFTIHVGEVDAGIDYALTVARGSQQAFVKAGDTARDAFFGTAVAISGDTMVIGAESAGGTGAAYVFVRDAATGVWSQQQRLQAHNAEPEDRFGHAVAISSDTIVIGAPSEAGSATMVNGADSNSATLSGAAYVFVRSDGAWSQQAYLKASNSGAFDLFGISVAIAGDTIAIGAQGEDGDAIVVNGVDSNQAVDSGAAYVFVSSGAIWAQQAYLKPENNGSGHNFGASVAVGRNGDSIAVGAPGENDADQLGHGSAYVFDRTDAAWEQTALVKVGAPHPGEAFGSSVAIGLEWLAVGTIREPNVTTGDGAGAVHAFERANGFTTAQELMPNDDDPGDEFGHAVAIDGEWILVGAPHEAGSARGVHAVATRADNAAARSGAAYLFARRATGWTQLAYLKASNADSSDRFGRSVAIHEGSLVVGAPNEASSATIVNPGPDAEADNTAPSSGAAYVFQ